MEIINQRLQENKFETSRLHDDLLRDHFREIRRKTNRSFNSTAFSVKYFHGISLSHAKDPHRMMDRLRRQNKRGIDVSRIEKIVKAGHDLLKVLSGIPK